MLSIGRTLFVCLVAHLCCGQNALDGEYPGSSCINCFMPSAIHRELVGLICPYFRRLCRHVASDHGQMTHSEICHGYSVVRLRYRQKATKMPTRVCDVLGAASVLLSC